MLTKEEFEQLYINNFKKIYNFFFYSLLNKIEAEDLTSETFLKFYRNIDKYDISRSLPSTYLYKIAHNVLNDFYRNAGKKTISIDELKTEPASDENKILLIDILSCLPERECLILYYKYYLDLSAKDISQLMGITATNVTTLCSRALAKLNRK